ncbi:MAG: hypothetical protein ACK8QZ_10930, partial [Anaerolineales bacterium]
MNKCVEFITAIAAKRRREEAMRRACRDEERAQAERVRAEAEAKTAALRAKEAQPREQAKIQNYLQSLWLQQANTSRPPLYPDPETADMTEAERAAAYHAWRVEETTYTPSPPPTSTAPQSQNGELDSATRSYQAWAKAIEEKKFDLKSYTQQMRLLSQFQELGITLHAGFTISEA